MSSPLHFHLTVCRPCLHPLSCTWAQWDLRCKAVCALSLGGGVYYTWAVLQFLRHWLEYDSLLCRCWWVFSEPSDHVVHVDFAAWWVTRHSGQGKHFTQQTKFTLAGLSCHLCFQVVLTNCYKKEGGKWKWVRQFNLYHRCVHSKCSIRVSWAWVNSHLWRPDLRLWLPEMKNYCRATELHFYWKKDDLNVNINTISTS